MSTEPDPIPGTDAVSPDAVNPGSVQPDTLQPDALQPDALQPEVLPAGSNTATGPGQPGADGSDDSPVREIESPGKIIRIGAMVKQLLEEVRNTDLDEASRDHLRDIYENSIKELKSALSPDLAAELQELSFDFSGEELPTSTELRLAKAQLVGWLEGLFHGIQATLMAQQMEARQQLEGMRAQLPEQVGPSHTGPGYL